MLYRLFGGRMLFVCLSELIVLFCGLVDYLLDADLIDLLIGVWILGLLGFGF